MLAVDHGYFLGPTAGMEEPAVAIPPLAPYADALMATRGLLRNTVDPAIVRSIVLRASGGPSIVGPALEDEAITTSVEDALRINAAAVTTQVFVGTPFERQSIANLALLVNEAGDTSFRSSGSRPSGRSSAIRTRATSSWLSASVPRSGPTS